MMNKKIAVALLTMSLSGGMCLAEKPTFPSKEVKKSAVPSKEGQHTSIPFKEKPAEFCPTVVQVSVLTDSFPGETSWDIKDASGTVVASRTSFPDPDTLYVDEGCLPETETCSGTDYTFTIYDSYGDGICCGYGEGSYEVTVGGELAASGGEFGSSESTSLCPTAPPTPCEGINAKVAVLTDSFPGETSWDIKDASGTVVASRTSFPDQDTLYEDDVCLPETETCSGTDYTFTIYDSYGDGICCGYGEGSYEVTVEGELAASGGEFEFSESTSLCPTGPPTPCEGINAKVAVTTDNYPGETSWDIKDASGTVVASRDDFPSPETLYEDDVCLPETETCSGTDYTFTIYDSYGDGICCGYGEGSYEVTVEGELAASGGEFGSSESTSLCDVLSEPTVCADIGVRGPCNGQASCFWFRNACRNCYQVSDNGFGESECNLAGCFWNGSSCE